METLEWDDGIDGDINVPIPIIDNDIVDVNQEVILSLGDVENTNLIQLDTSILTIVDDDKQDVIIETPVDEIATPVTSIYIPIKNTCSSGNVIDTTCDFAWDKAKNNIGKNGNVSHLIVKIDIKMKV